MALDARATGIDGYGGGSVWNLRTLDPCFRHNVYYNNEIRRQVSGLFFLPKLSNSKGAANSPSRQRQGRNVRHNPNIPHLPYILSFRHFASGWHSTQPITR